MSKTTWAIVIGVVVIMILAVGASLLIPLGGRALGFGFFRPGLIGGFGLPFLFMRGMGTFLIWMLIIIGAIWLFRSGGRSTATSTGTLIPGESPLDILKRRYANGEISKEQFDEMRTTLGL